MTEGTPYDLVCNILNVAPLKKLIVKWYKENTMISQKVFQPDMDVNVPQNASSSYNFTPKKSDSNATFRCEAHMDLGPEGPRLTSSQKYQIEEIQCKYAITFRLFFCFTIKSSETVTGRLV